MERGKTQMKFNPKDNQKEKGKETALTASVEVKITQQEQKGSCSGHKHWNQRDGVDVLDYLHHRIQSQYRPQERHLEYHLFMRFLFLQAFQSASGETIVHMHPYVPPDIC
jgi:hypothetical protein